MSQDSKNSPRLVVIEGKDKGKVIPLQSGTVVLGRSKGDVIIPDARISRSHVSLHYDEKKRTLTFEDLKSLNGTQLNGESATSGELHDGDRLQIGNTILDCQLFIEAPAASDSETATSARRKKTPVSDENQPLSAALSSELPGESNGEPSQVRTELREEQPSPAPSPQSWRRIFTKKNRNLATALLVLLLLYAALSDDGKKNQSSKAPVTEAVGERESGEALTVENIDDKIAGWEEALKEDPQDVDAMLSLGKAYSQLGKYEEALAVLHRARGISGVSPLVHVRLIHAYLKTGKGKEAEAELNSLDSAIKAGRHSKELFVEAASLYLEFREIKQSPEKTLILAKALQNQFAPGDTVGYKLEAQALQQMNRSDDAMMALEKGLALQPDDEWLLENQAFLYLTKKDIGRAISSVGTWIQLHPKTTKPFLVMGYLKYNQKDYAGTVETLQKAVDNAKEGGRDPYLAEAMSLLGQAYEGQGKTEEPRTYFKAACELGFQAACARVATQPSDVATGSADKNKSQ